MRTLPLNIGPIHFVGIGGIGMSGIAEIMHELGYKVQGSDISKNTNILRLQKLGIKVKIGHSKENISNVGVVVVSSAINFDNPELIASRENFIPVVKRAEMLAELMRFKWSIAVGGTHGKTTTTSMIASVLERAQFDPTVINGGIINAYDTNARKGSSDWMVVEADESDGSFVKLPATVAIVTNIDPEHLDFYKNFENERKAFKNFVENIPFYGFACMCIDHPEVQVLCSQISDRRIITYGLSSNADLRAENIKILQNGSQFDLILNEPIFESRKIKNVNISMPGKHNVQNALAAFLVGLELGIDDKLIIESLRNFSGVKRRFSITGVVNDIKIIDDYAHHPVEIKSVLSAARSVTNGKVIAVMQPHRYSRLRDLFDDFCVSFNDADIVIISDIYEAGENPILGINKQTLINGIGDHGHRNVFALNNHEDLPSIINDIANPTDTVICMGAGTISKWANDLPMQINNLRKSDTKLGVCFEKK
ncbi:MAG: UDP-N-acetylmuramate--L-alanine ligase [Alphaproteobacteria bacterium MarineAlpha2_Bin1]|nr:MAG: UDP-N-acetylmuramate--L-alanine ligase [Alphaproteobacteria bacterium MarineAlpha2_Bin1]|tara:strand:- start:592 stop:2034 length:1443 start_codon:yes stop_codon:yes gene_type:complete